jgi:DNA-binding transcriptional ArsR family regulator
MGQAMSRTGQKGNHGQGQDKDLRHGSKPDQGQDQQHGLKQGHGQDRQHETKSNQSQDQQHGSEQDHSQDLHCHHYQDYVDLNIEVFVRLAELYKNFSDPTRLKIIHELSKGALHVQEIADRLGMSQSAISHQLRILRNVRLVKFEREGRAVRYALDDNHVEDILRIGVEHVRHTAQQ